MIVVAGFFTSFLLYLALGLLALLVTAALDRLLGKERALLLWAVAILGITLALKPQAPAPLNPRAKELRLPEGLDPTKPLASAADVFARDPLAVPERNAFQEQSDTNSLPPDRIPEPPAVPLAFPLPPTVPGVGHSARRILRGAVSAVKSGDGSALPDVPVDGHVAYQPKPEDVFDWVVQGGQRWYVFIRSIDDARDGSPEYEEARGLKWNLALQEGPPAFAKPWGSLRVQFAAIGPEEEARKWVATPGKARGLRVSTSAADQQDRWYLRRSVDNLFVEACRAAGAPRPEDLGVDALKQVAATMARVGETGKEDGLGWRKAVQVLQLALTKAEAMPGRNPSDVLVQLLEAYRAIHDERALLATLARYLEVSGTGGAQAEGAAWLGDALLARLGLPDRAAEFYDRALRSQPGLKAALAGRGDARLLLGDVRGALKDYRAAADAGARTETAAREAEAQLRLGDLAAARAAADAALAADAFDARALLAKGAVLYAQGDVAGARESFAQACVLPGEGPAGAAARRHRAEALYDLGLAEFRLGHGDAAIAAFDAADAALRAGSSTGRSADEAVSPDLGRALVQLGLGNVQEAVDAIERARERTPGVAHLDVLSGWISMQQGDPARARARFEAALALAPDLWELDGWLGQTRLDLAEAAVAEGRPAAEVAADFEAAVRFAERAARREAQADPKSTDFAVREALARVKDQSQSERRRFEAARKTATDLLDRSREERRALAVKGYCNYRLGGATGDPALYDQCLRDYQQVIDVAAPEGDPWRPYAQDCLARIKRWLALEEKNVAFSEAKLSNEWATSENNGVRAGPDEGWLVFKDVNVRIGATADGTPTDPTVVARGRKLFGRDSLELVQAWVSIPKTDREGAARNNVIFGFAIQGASGDARGLAKNQGIGVFYDKGKVAVRVGSGQDPLYKDGELHRVVKDGQELDWPEDPTGLGVLVEIERLDRDGTVSVRVGGREVVRDKVPAFKRARGDAELWVGGWSNKAQNWDVRVDRVRIVRSRQ